MLINLSNHPSSGWSTEQKKAAAIYGEIFDLSFPSIDPEGDEHYISSFVEKYVDEIENIKKSADICDITVHIMGELTFVYSLVNELKNRNIFCIASTTERIS